ncbi:hypothetical protein [Rhodanobacter denitrificans]|uniref:Uncharacterized protein n=1 Tax=Rhodanobacter denitrificans TaxID=666685 RepID=M4NE25_9GAMM|nr:hypothetical protein [Rhodanobacter denitrificans]AGG87748.1 hypothetical protein R2APBS1_0579 [Rhodanobacter denitrificans]UJM86915.1 hypothetical protein LRJ86_00960 [Rhodanobacter denitrificans]
MNTTNLDDISLEQALIDFEVANTRVIDLTARLTALSKELLQAKTELATIKLRGSVPVDSAAYRAINVGDMGELAHLREVVRQLRASRVVRVALLFSSKLRKVLG